MHRLSRIEPVQPKNEINATNEPKATINKAASDIDVLPLKIFINTDQGQDQDKDQEIQD